MTDAVVSYPFDPTGQSGSNRIVGEQIIILPPGDRLFHYTMVKFAPMFEEGHSIKLRDLNNNVIPLTMGVDYYLGHKFMDASLATMHPIWGSIQFLRRDIVGTLIVDYQTLGGIWTLDSAKIAEILIDAVRNPRITTWEQVTDRPIDFPVIDHLWNLDDMVGQKEILAVLTNFYNAYLASLDPLGSGGGAGLLAAHVNNKSNPHQVTAAQVGAYSISQMDTMLAGYVKTSAQATDSAKLGGLTLSDLMASVVTTKVNAAYNADKASLADSTTLAIDSSKFGGKTAAQWTADIVATKVSNAVKADTATTATTATSATDSTKLGGKTYADIVAALATVKVTNAVNADHATLADTTTLANNSSMFDGHTWTEAMAIIVAAASTTTATSQLADHANTADLASNSLQLEGNNLATVLSLAAAGTAANASRLANLTVDDLTTQILAGTAASAMKIGDKDYAAVLTDMATKDTAADAANTTVFNNAATALNTLLATPAA